MKTFIPILIIAIMSTGCIARKIVTVPAKVVIKTSVKTTGKVAVGTTKAVLPGGGDKK